jgi:hypothetical protein
VSSGEIIFPVVDPWIFTHCPTAMFDTSNH